MDRGPGSSSTLPARAGAVTLLELLTTLTVGAVILGGIFAMLFTSQISSAETLTISRVEYAAKLSLLKIENDVIESSVKSPHWSLPDRASSDHLTFNRCTGTSDGTRVWSPPITYRLEGERIVRETAGSQAILADGIRALSFNLQGGDLRVAVSAHGEHRGQFSYDTTAGVEFVLRN
jgi:hypothetical protein